MKDFTVIDYAFVPGISGVGYVDLYGAFDFDINRVISIINQTRGVIIYATGSADTKYTSVTGTKVYLNVDTSTHSATDEIQIVYNSSDALQTVDNEAGDLIRLLSRLVKVMENQQATDAAQRQRITLDNISAGVTLPTVTTVTGVTTVTTVTTCSTVTNAASIAGMNQEQYINIARNAYANSIRSKLSFS